MGNILRAVYDSTNKKLMVEYKSYLLEDYLDLLVSCMSLRSDRGLLPKGIEVKRVEDNKCLIMIPVVLSTPPNQAVGVLPPNLTSPISEALSDFREKALKTEFMTTEFIPLEGYPLKDLKKDMKAAINNKRNFCLIDNYANYLNFSKNNQTTIKAKKIKYLSNDYSNICIYIYGGKMAELKKEFGPQLKDKSWE